jgi:hypothetical protein
MDRKEQMQQYLIPAMKLKRELTEYNEEHFGGARGVKELLSSRKEFYKDKDYYDKYVKTKYFEAAILQLWHLKSLLIVSPYDKKPR